MNILVPLKWCHCYKMGKMQIQVFFTEYCMFRVDEVQSKFIWCSLQKIEFVFDHKMYAALDHLGKLGPIFADWALVSAISRP
jgi:hypothetical protein